MRRIPNRWLLPLVTAGLVTAGLAAPVGGLCDPFAAGRPGATLGGPGTGISRLPATGVRSGRSMRFFGNGIDAPGLDRVKIPIDDVDDLDDEPGPPVDVGATDFTIEFWMKAAAAENTAGPQACGDNINWIFGNVVIDRDRFNEPRKFGLSIAGGSPIFGVTGESGGPSHGRRRFGGDPAGPLRSLETPFPLTFFLGQGLPRLRGRGPDRPGVAGPGWGTLPAGSGVTVRPGTGLPRDPLHRVLDGIVAGPSARPGSSSPR